eukprot:RCo012460
MAARRGQCGARGLQVVPRRSDQRTEAPHGTQRTQRTHRAFRGQRSGVAVLQTGLGGLVPQLQRGQPLQAHSRVGWAFAGLVDLLQSPQLLLPPQELHQLPDLSLHVPQGADIAVVPRLANQEVISGEILVEQHPGARVRHRGDQPGEREHHQRRAHYQQEVAGGEVVLRHREEPCREVFSEEDDVGLHKGARLGIPHDGLPGVQLLLNEGNWHRLERGVDRVRRCKGPMALDQQIGVDVRSALQAVNVLGVVAQQQTLLAEKLDEQVHVCGLIVPWPHLLSDNEEGLGVLAEEVQLEHGLRKGQVVLLQLRVQPRAGGAEVRDPRGHGNPCPGHHNDPLGLPVEDSLRNLAQRELLQDGFPGAPHSTPTAVVRHLLHPVRFTG